MRDDEMESRSEATFASRLTETCFEKPVWEPSQSTMFIVSETLNRNHSHE